MWMTAYNPISNFIPYSFEFYESFSCNRVFWSQKIAYHKMQDCFGSDANREWLQISTQLQSIFVLVANHIFGKLSFEYWKKDLMRI
jgi:hypothetical protein